MEKYTERVTVYASSLDREEIDEFISIARSDFPADHGFDIDLEHENVELRASSMDELASNDRIPDQLNNLTIRVWEPRSYSGVGQLRRSVYFSVGALGPHVTIDGVDETWVAGMNQRLQRFFDRKRPRSTRVRQLLRHRVTMSALVGIAFVLNLQVASRLSIWHSLLFAIASIYLLAVYINWAVWAFAGEVRIHLRKTTRQFLGMERKDSLPIIISLVILVVMAAQMVIDLVK